jgi:hypothetical protein
MAKFVSMQFGWMIPIVILIDDNEAVQAPSMQDDHPVHPRRLTRIVGAITARFGARYLHGD